MANAGLPHQRADGSNRLQEQRSRVAAKIYESVFVRNPDGKLVLEDLVMRFHDRPIYVAGAGEGERETARRAAQQEVIRFILMRIGQVHAEAEAGGVN